MLGVAVKIAIPCYGNEERTEEVPENEIRVLLFPVMGMYLHCSGIVVPVICNCYSLLWEWKRVAAPSHIAAMALLFPVMGMAVVEPAGRELN